VSSADRTANVARTANALPTRTEDVELQTKQPAENAELAVNAVPIANALPMETADVDLPRKQPVAARIASVVLTASAQPRETVVVVSPRRIKSVETIANAEPPASARMFASVTELHNSENLLLTLKLLLGSMASRRSS